MTKLKMSSVVEGLFGLHPGMKKLPGPCSDCRRSNLVACGQILLPSSHNFFRLQPKQARIYDT